MASAIIFITSHSSFSNLNLPCFNRNLLSKTTLKLRRRIRPRWDPPSLIFGHGGDLQTLLLRAGSEHNHTNECSPKTNSELEAPTENINTGEGYIGLFVRMLGLDNDPLDREHAVVTLWKYSLGGRNCIDGIMKFPGCINLVVSLIKSDLSSTCEAAAGLLRTVSSVNIYRNIIAESGAIEELCSLLYRSSLTSEVKEQSLCTLWNLSIDEKLRVKLADAELVPVLVKYLSDEDMMVKEAAGGILANLSLSPCIHSQLVEAGVIPKLANIIRNNEEDCKVIRKEAKATLLELAKDDYYRTIIIEEGLVRVPIVGSSAYKSFKSPTYSWPSLPDGTTFQKNPRPSRYGASELLLGLNVNDKKFNLEESKMNAIVGRSQQQFLARIGAIEANDGRKLQFTILPWVDGVARLVLILGLENELAITRAAYSIAEASINDSMRISFKEAGAVKYLVQLISHDSQSLQEAAANALERLCVSYEVCQTAESEGALALLISVLKSTKTSKDLLEKTVSILSQFFDPSKDMKRKRDNYVVNGFSGKQNYSVNSEKSSDLKTMDGITSETERMKLIDSSVIAILINMLRNSSPSWQVKAASILEYIASNGSLATTVTEYDIESALEAVFQQVSLSGTKDGTIDDELELDIIKAEEIGLAIAAATRLLAKLLNSDQFLNNIDSSHLVHALRDILKSNIPLHSKNWVAACLVKLETLASSKIKLEKPIEMEVIIYETIPRLVEQLEMSFSLDVKETAAIELNHVISRGGVECTRAVAANGGIFSLVRLLEEANREAMESSLAILYNLSMDNENHAALISAGVVPVLKRIVHSEGPQWVRALNLLRNLPI